jgi:hypothetical protein
VFMVLPQERSIELAATICTRPSATSLRPRRKGTGTNTTSLNPNRFNRAEFAS